MPEVGRVARACPWRRRHSGVGSNLDQEWRLAEGPLSWWAIRTCRPLQPGRAVLEFFPRESLSLNTVSRCIIPDNEEQRIEAVRRYDILDTPPDGAFDRITALAARRFGVPISIISIVDEDRIWFKSHHGVPVSQIGRDPGLCASAILSPDPHVLTDAKIDPRSLANPLVAGEFGLRFYAGVPLRTSDGYHLGTLCVIDKAPRPIDQNADRRSHGSGLRGHGPDGAAPVGASRGLPSRSSWRGRSTIG